MRTPRRQLQPFTHRWPVGHPPVWILLIAANVGVFMTQLLINYSEFHWLEHGLGLSDYGVKHGYFWQFFTYTFLHGSFMHLFTNMLLLYFAGRELEALVGAKHFLTVYFGGGLLGGLAEYAHWSLSSAPPPEFLIGASAGVFAVLIAFTTILPELELTCLLFFVIPIRIRARNLALLLTGSTVLFILVPYLDNLGNHALDMLSHNPGSVAHYAHLGGAIFGWLYVKQLGYGNPWRIQKYFFEKRQLEERRKHMTSAQFITEEIDPILEKISRDGIRSLTRNERHILNMGREKMKPRS